MRWTDDFGLELHVHDANDDCTAYGCCIHNPSNHKMVKFRLLWRTDWGLMERVCPHGIGHPDPDHLAFSKRTRPDTYSKYEDVHGCDGCCL